MRSKPDFFAVTILLILVCLMGPVTSQAQDRLDSLFLDPIQNKDAIINEVKDAVAYYKKRLLIEPKLINVLNDKNTSPAAKAFAAEQLYRICDEDTIADFGKMLLRKATSDHARIGLEKIDHSDAQSALLLALDKASGTILVGIIQSLGERGEPSAAKSLRRLAMSGNAQITEPALEALGKIPGPESMDTLDWCRSNLRRSMRPKATKAYMQCGWKSLSTGDLETASDIFDSLLIEIEPLDVRKEAMSGYIRASGVGSVPVILETLQNGPPELQKVAVEEAGLIPGVEATEALIVAYPDLTDTNQGVLLGILGVRGDPVSLPILIQGVHHRIPALRIVALEALQPFNNADAVIELLKTAATGSEQEKALAHAAIIAIDEPRLNDTLVKAGMNADNAIRNESIRYMQLKKVRKGVPALIRIAERDVAPMRMRAITAIGHVGSPDQVPSLLDLMAMHSDSGTLGNIIDSIDRIVGDAPPGENRVFHVAEASSDSDYSVDVRVRLVQLLGKIQDDAGLPALSRASKDSSEIIQSAAVNALALWPNPNPIYDLERAARSGRTSAIQQTAYDGALNLVGKNKTLTDADRLKIYKRQVRLAKTTEQKIRFIEEINKWGHSTGFTLIEKWRKDPELQTHMNSTPSN
jgi:HEAT repeat protein